MAGISNVVCGFCANPIRLEGPDPVSLTIVHHGDDQAQQFFVHWACLRSAVHHSTPLLPPAD